MTMGCSSHFGGGEPSTTSIMRRSHVRRVRAFTPGVSTRVSTLSSYQPVIGATGYGIVASPASGAPKSEDHRRFTFWCICDIRRQALVRWRGSLPAHLQRDGLLQAVLPLRRQLGKRGKRGRTGSSRPGCQRARIGRSSVVLARHCRSCKKSIGGVRLREACVLYFTRFRGRAETGV